MFAPLSKTSGRVHRCAVLLLALWLGGLGCVLGCEMNALAASADEPQVSANAESCPSSDHDCCKKKQNVKDKEDKSGESSVEEAPQGTNDMPSCCPLAVQPSDPARKSRLADAPLATAGHASLITPDFQTSNALPLPRLRVPDRGSTYLRCCVFLI